MLLLNRVLRHVVVVRPARRKTVASLEQELRASTEVVRSKLASATESYDNHKVATHIIGIERWGQAHLNALIKGTDYTGEYDPFRPAQDTDWDALGALFTQTRNDTLALLPRLSDVPPERTTTHNSFGELTAVQWLQYIDSHASFEARLLK